MISKKKRIRKRENTLFQNIIVVIVFLVVFGGGIGFLTYQNIKINEKRGELEGKLESLQAEAADLSVRKEELERGVQEIESEEYQEKILREQGLYKKPGEEVVTVLPSEESQQQTTSPEEKERVWWNPLSWF